MTVTKYNFKLDVGCCSPSQPPNTELPSAFANETMSYITRESV